MYASLVDRESLADVADLVDRARAGDVEAFGTLYDLHHLSVYRMLLKLTRSHALAEDLTSETFFRAMRSIARSQVRGDYVMAWLMRIARNLAVDHFKARQTRLELPMDPHDHDLVEELAEGPETEVLASIQYATLLRAVGELPANQRMCITARFLDDLSIAETALLMECSEGAVKQLQFRGVRNLARSLDLDVD
jgi:RNA polymerase sigma-70 factor (ECF subfamily)